MVGKCAILLLLVTMLFATAVAPVSQPQLARATQIGLVRLAPIVKPVLVLQAFALATLVVELAVTGSFL